MNLMTSRKSNKIIVIRDTKALGKSQAGPMGTFLSHLWSKAVLARLDSAQNPIYSLIRKCDPTAIQVSAYGPGDYYDDHIDQPDPRSKSVFIDLTVLLLICDEPKPFRGGDFVMSFRGAEKTIPYKNNRLIIFPCKTMHRVTPVRSTATSFSKWRFSIQFWPKFSTHSRLAQKPVQKPNVVKIDEPTFAIETQMVAQLKKFFGIAFDGDTEHELDAWESFYSVLMQLQANLRWLNKDLWGETCARSTIESSIR